MPSSDASQFCFESKGYKTSVVLSHMSLDISQDKLLGAAERYALFRQEAEIATRHGEPIQFGDNWVELRDTKDVAEVAYAGYDSKTIFRFFGFVTQRKVLSLWVATETRDNGLSKRVFDEVFRGFEVFTCPNQITAPNCRPALQFRSPGFFGRCIRWQRPFPRQSVSSGVRQTTHTLRLMVFRSSLVDQYGVFLRLDAWPHGSWALGNGGCSSRNAYWNFWRPSLRTQRARAETGTSEDKAHGR